LETRNLFKEIRHVTAKHTINTGAIKGKMNTEKIEKDGIIKR